MNNRDNNVSVTITEEEIEELLKIVEEEIDSINYRAEKCLDRLKKVTIDNFNNNKVIISLDLLMEIGKLLEDISEELERNEIDNDYEEDYETTI